MPQYFVLLDIFHELKIQFLTKTQLMIGIAKCWQQTSYRINHFWHELSLPKFGSVQWVLWQDTYNSILKTNFGRRIELNLKYQKVVYTYMYMQQISGMIEKCSIFMFCLDLSNIVAYKNIFYFDLQCTFQFCSSLFQSINLWIYFYGFSSL